MIYIYLAGHNYYEDVLTITQIFYQNNKYVREYQVNMSGITVCSFANGKNVGASIYNNGQKTAEKEYNWDSGIDEKELKRLIKLSAYRVLESVHETSFPWGILTGIRPSKKVFEYWRTGYSDIEIKATLKNKYIVSDEKIDLMLQVAATEKEVINNLKDEISLYISIPFCPSTCVYCSFGSYPLARYKNKIDNYLDSLDKELAQIKNITNKKIHSIYVGGGTPTSLDKYGLLKLMQIISRHIDIDSAAEFTVEAGRPDTLNIEKLKILKQNNVSRISINPQSMNSKTLLAIGRNHTSDDIIKAFYMARETGHTNINMDTILGLPNENLSDVEQTFKEIKKLKPDSITVHTLAVKRASKLKEEAISLITQNELEAMLKTTSDFAKNMDMRPYYLYRQKNMLGNFENVGYSIRGKECRYNILIMEEVQTIIAVGAGATTKIVDPRTNKISRVFNLKDVDLYITRIDEMIQRKIAAFAPQEDDKI